MRLAERLADSELVRRIVVLETTGSTNEDIRRLAAEGAPEGTVVIAWHQSAGRGRLGRAWESPDRLGVYCSLLLRPVDPPDRLGRYALAAAVAVAETCREFADDRVVLKWPNDVLAEGRKLAGILAETRQGPLGTELVLGVGVNVAQLEADFSVALSRSAISLRILRHGDEPDRESVAASLLGSLGRATASLRAGEWEDVAERFLRYAPDATGRRVSLSSGGFGVTRGLDVTGALRVETENGLVLAHATGSVSLVEE